VSKPSEFIMSTDYATLKNDDTNTISVTFPSGLILTAGQRYVVTQDLVIGTINASSRVRISSSKISNQYFAGCIAWVDRTGVIAGPTNVPYALRAFITRINPTTVRAVVGMLNPYSEGMATAFGDETFTFEIDTFLSPFV
jgi:hypothetical protein